MDSDPAVLTAPLPTEAPAEARSRLAWVAPAARGAVRLSWRTAAVGALGAAAVWAALFRTALADGSMPWGASLLVAAVLLVPAAAAAVLAWTLGGLVDLPGDLRAAARDVSVPTRAAGIGGLLQTAWALRSVVMGSTEAWARTAGLARLASLPLVLGLLAAVALNAVVALAGLVALAWMIL